MCVLNPATTVHTLYFNVKVYWLFPKELPSSLTRVFKTCLTLCLFIPLFVGVALRLAFIPTYYMSFLCQ